MARICWGDNTDCDLIPCQNSQLSFPNTTFTTTTGTTEYLGTKTGTCNSGYIGGPITATCNSNESWNYSGGCVTSSGSITYSNSGLHSWYIPEGLRSTETTIAIKAFGAQGGGSCSSSYGGYSYGTYKLPSSGLSYLYIVVGGVGTCGAGFGTAGYNGCGYDATDGCGTNSGHGCGGGGATHVAKVSGLLKNLSSNDVLIVAGGGGKSESYNCGGAGGGANMSGYNGDGEYKGYGGTTSSGGSGNNGNASGIFGLGGNVTRRSTTKAKWCGGAGGGYYGGGAGEWANKSDAGGGGGDSGFCGNGMQNCYGRNGVSFAGGGGFVEICWGSDSCYTTE